ncbi:MAG: cytochrome c oxidase subunit 3 [Alphaproteobacteria bacterium]
MAQPKQASAPENLMFHPNNIMLALLLFGLSFLFLALTISYTYIRVTMGVPPVQLPVLFLVNTLLLLGSSYTMIRAKRCYLDDQTEAYQQSLKYTIVLSVLFMLMQVVGWWWLFRMNQIGLGSSTTAGFLYVISFTHLAHVVAGLPFLVLFYRTARKRMVDPVTVLVYFSDPEKRLKLRLLTIYWHFLDILWVYLVVFLGINYLI